MFRINTLLRDLGDWLNALKLIDTPVRVYGAPMSYVKYFLHEPNLLSELGINQWLVFWLKEHVALDRTSWYKKKKQFETVCYKMHMVGKMF